MYTRKQDINSLRKLENKIVYSIYSRKQDCILYVYQKTRLHSLFILENKIIYSMYTRNQHYILYTRNHDYILYVH